MPQFDVTWFPSQLFWLVALFFVLAVLMYRVAVPLVEGTIKRRTERVEEDLDRAARLKAEIDLVVAAREKAISEARAQAADILRATRDRVAHAAAEKHRDTAAALSAQIKSAEHRIELAKTKALLDVHAIAADIATVVAARLIGPGSVDGTIGAIVDDVIGGRG